MVNEMHVMLSNRCSAENDAALPSTRGGPQGRVGLLSGTSQQLHSQTRSEGKKAFPVLWSWNSSENCELSLPRTMHPFFHEICKTGWMVLINLIWKTDGKFFPEVNSLGYFQKEAMWLLPAVCVWQHSLNLCWFYMHWGWCVGNCGQDPRRLWTVVQFIACRKHLQMSLPAELSDPGLITEC